MTERTYIPVTVANEVYGKSVQDVLGNAFKTVRRGALSPSDEIDSVIEHMRGEALEQGGQAVVGMQVMSSTPKKVTYGGAIVTLKPAATP